MLKVPAYGNDSKLRLTLQITYRKSEISQPFPETQSLNKIKDSKIQTQFSESLKSYIDNIKVLIILII